MDDRAAFSYLVQICYDRFESLEKEEKASVSGSETKESKKPSAFDFTRIEKIRNLSPENLVTQFSVSTFNEMQKWYFFKCVFHPEKCDKVFKSYGSEKKAHDEIKQHLLEHRSDLEIRTANGVLPTMKKNASLDVSSLSDSNERVSHGNSRCDLDKTEHSSGIKMPKPNRNRRTKKKPTKLFNTSLKKRKSKKEVASSCGLKTNLLLKSVNCLMGNNKPNLKPDNQQVFAVDPLEDNKKQDVIVEEVVRDCAQPSTSKISSPIKTNSIEDVIDFEALAKISLSYEHSYASLNGLKVKEINIPPVKNPAFRKRGCYIPPQLIIRTPPFPFIYEPILPDCSSVEEIGLEFTYDQMKTQSSAECVENIVDLIASSDISSSDDNNVENSEKIQETERDLSLKCIAWLKCKKTMQLHGPLVCKICKNKRFTARNTLINHYRSHAGIKPFTCDVCERTFTRQYTLKYHYTIHTGQSRFTCEYCKHKFRHPTHYKEHLRRHTGETPFECNNCSLKFKTRNAYKRHLKKPHNTTLVAENSSD